LARTALDGQITCRSARLQAGWTGQIVGKNAGATQLARPKQPSRPVPGIHSELRPQSRAREGCRHGNRVLFLAKFFHARTM
jgi:hypothetical protein